MYYNLYALYRTGILDDEACVERLCSMIEMAGPLQHSAGDSNRYSAHEKQDEAAPAATKCVLHYLLWKALSEALGQVSPMLTPEQEILANTDVMNYLAAAAPAAPAAAASMSMTSADTSAVEELRATALGRRGWWRSSFLCAAQLDAFHPSAVVPSAQQVEAIMRHCVGSDADDASVTSTGEESSVKLVLEDSYAAWLHSEKAFDENLDGAFTSMKRKMSEEDSEGEGYWKDGKGQDGDGSGEDDGVAGVGGEASQMSNTSHDEAEYHSQDSGVDAGATQEDSGAAGAASGGGGASQPRTALRFVQEILSIAVQSKKIESAAAAVADPGAGCGVTVLPALCAQDFAVKKAILRAPAGSRDRTPRVEYSLGDRQLETLACQAVVSAHLYSQDNLFTVNAVMVILQHAVRTNAATTLGESTQAARNCVGIITRGGVNINRALKIGQALAARAVDPARPPY
jgi:hypothetical protein